VASRRVTLRSPHLVRQLSVHSKAIAREKELKGWRRAKKIALIESTNLAWMDLNRDWYDCEPADYRRALDRINA
jgi:predicted GIY-YIG superfamily endonuclease